MAFRKLFSKRAVTNDYGVASPAVALDHPSPIKSLTAPRNNAASKTKLFKEFFTGDSVHIGFFRCLFPPPLSHYPATRTHAHAAIAREAKKLGISVEDAKKILRVSLVEKLKAKLREIPKGSICYSEFVTGLYCGLGFPMIQTLGFLRLTFWELNWDVMEPIHFAVACGFFLRTSTEPSFQGFFQKRFKARQKKLVNIHGFDVQKYNRFRKVVYPGLGYGSPQNEYYINNLARAQ
uniref:Calcium uniporter protein C-terminal domain-containing protein n=1 Tax=Salix viminalis TaxID=40686 RepID=A0A6N2MKN3_SALVM